MSINKRFKDFRDSLRLSQTVLAEKLSTNQSGIADIETGRKLPNENIMEYLHFNYGLNLNWLICGSGKMKLNEYDTQHSHVSEPQAEYVKAGLEDRIKDKETIIQMQQAEIARLREALNKAECRAPETAAKK